MAIKHKRKNTAAYSWQTADLVEGQIGLNIADGTLHFKKSNDAYIKIGDTTGFGTGNGTVTDVAALTIGTTGTNISSTVATGTSTPVITLNIPTASASNRGALSSTDWSTFNGKQAALTSGTNIKTVNSTTILGSGNIAVGTVTSVAGTGTVAGLSLSGTVTSTGNLTLGGTLSVGSVTGTLAVANGGTGAATARDAWDGLTTYTATNSASVSLTAASNYIQHVYGGSGTTFTLPSTATMTFGEGFYIINNSGATTTVNTSTSASVGTIPTGGAMRLHVTNTGSNAATSWIVMRDFESITGTGSAVLSASPTITGSAVIGGTTLPSATGTTGQVLALSSAGTAAWTTASSGSQPVSVLRATTRTTETGTTYRYNFTELGDSTGITSISAGNITIAAAGTYLFEFDANNYSTNPGSSWAIYDATGSVDLRSESTFFGPASSQYQIPPMKAVHTISTSNVYAIRQVDGNLHSDIYLKITKLA